MNWIHAAMIMFFSSVFLYILIRKASLLQIPTELINLASMGVPLFFYIALAYQKSTPLMLSTQQLVVLMLLSLFGSYIPNIASLKSIKYAPNPGYSLIISKSYVVLTAIAAVFLFGSRLHLKNALAIGVIVGFSILVMIGKTKKHMHGNPIWLPLSFVSFLGWGFLSIGTKYAFMTGLNILQRLIYLSIFVTCFIIIEMMIRRISFKPPTIFHMVLLIAIGILSASFNYFMVLGIDLTPNIGYINAINASSISAVTVLSIVFFKDDFSFKKMLGVFGVSCGLLLLVI